MAYYYSIRKSDPASAAQTVPRGLQFEGIDPTSPSVTVRLRYVFTRATFSPIFDARTAADFSFSGATALQTGGNANSVIASNIDAIRINTVDVPLSQDNQTGDVTKDDVVELDYSGANVKSYMSIGHNYADWAADIDVYAIEIEDNNGLHVFTIDGVAQTITDSNTTNPITVTERNPPAGEQWVFYDDGGGAVAADTVYTINAPTFTSSASASLPQPVANGAFSIVSPTFTSTASATLPNPTADASYTVTAPTFSVDSTATLPQPTANAAFSLPAPTFAASAAATEPGFNASVNFTLPAPTFSADATATLPQPIADGNFTITAPTFSVVAIAGGIAIIVDNETNINMPALSTNINAPVLSNNVRI